MSEIIISIYSSHGRLNFGTETAARWWPTNSSHGTVMTCYDNGTQETNSRVPAFLMDPKCGKSLDISRYLMIVVFHHHPRPIPNRKTAENSEIFRAAVMVSTRIKMLPGWWYTYLSEKYEFVNWDDELLNIWKNNKMVQTNQLDNILIPRLNASCVLRPDTHLRILNFTHLRILTHLRIHHKNFTHLRIHLGGLGWG